jgi:hypothetical protein
MVRVITLILFLAGLTLTLVLAPMVNPVELSKFMTNTMPGEIVMIPPGTYELTAPLELKSGISLIGSGPDKTIIKAAPSWIPGFDGLPQQENPNGYLFNLMGTNDVLIADLTLTGPNLHGAIYAENATGVELSNLQIINFQWSSLRTFGLDNLKVHDCRFIDAGGQFQSTGGALFITYTRNSEFWNNKILKSEDLDRNFFGFKGYGGNSNRFHHNDVQVSFSFEFPFENYRNVEIDHNRSDGVMSIPKHGGGPVLEDIRSFHIHHNWFRSSYALEWARNSVEIDHNLFDFDENQDGGNLISNFGDQPAAGPTYFHDNLIKNPGRGLFWSEGIYNQFKFYNNHVRANGQNRKGGFFGFNQNSNFDTILIKDNIIEHTEDNPRPLMRNEASYQAEIINNTLVNISDAEKYSNSSTGDPQGPVTPLEFTVGVNGEYQVDGWIVQ